MSKLGSREASLAFVPDSPAVKRQKTATGGWNSTNNSTGYNSGTDSGDDLFEGIATTPVGKYQTQPTQIIDRGIPPSSPSMSTSEVQIPASSPFRSDPPKQSPVPQLSSSSFNAGRAANIVAPAGTSFRTPHGVVRAPVAKPKPKPITISDDEDNGPQHKGGSSDDEGRFGSNIKPSSFLAKAKGNHLGVHGASDYKPELAPGPLRFSRILQSSVYQGSQISNGRSGDPSSGTASLTQTRPARAALIGQTMDLDDVPEIEMRRKIARLRSLNPQGWSVLKCRDALVAKKWNVDDAALMLAGPSIVISDDDEIKSPEDQNDASKLQAQPQMKAQLKAPIKSIQERYSSAQHQKIPAIPLVKAATPPRPVIEKKRRLMQGRRRASSSTSPAFSATPIEKPKATKPTPPQIILSDHEDYDSGVASAVEDDPELDGRVLDFLNKCSVDDLADLASIKRSLAETMLSRRPFKSLNAARNVSDATTTKAGKKSSKAPIGEKIVQSTIDMWSGYEAVDSLVAKCEELGKPLAAEMSNWGFNVFGAQKDGELEITSLDDESDTSKDSAIVTSTNGDAGEDNIKGARKRKTFLKKPINMSEDTILKDYQLVGLNWLALLYKYKLSCILADDMGLGKTCQVIAFLSHLVSTGVSGPHLVIVPPSTLENWLREFQKFSPDLVVEPYYGSQNERAEAADRLLEQRQDINVVVSTYDFATKPVDNKFIRRLRPEVCLIYRY